MSTTFGKSKLLTGACRIIVRSNLVAISLFTESIGEDLIVNITSSKAKKNNYFYVKQI